MLIDILLCFFLYKAGGSITTQLAGLPKILVAYVSHVNLTNVQMNTQQQNMCASKFVFCSNIFVHLFLKVYSRNLLQEISAILFS